MHDSLRKNSWKKAIALVTSFVFLLTSVQGFPVFAEAASAPAAVRKLAVQNPGIPENLGTIEDSFQGKTLSAVILVQDAHTIPDAQANTRGLIEFFQKEYGLNQVAVEGAASRMDLSLFRSFPDKEKLAKVFEGYEKSGEVTGAELAAVFSPHESVYEGIEAWDLYEKALTLFLDAMENESAILEKIGKEKDGLRAEKKLDYPKALFEIDQSLEAFADGKTDFISAFQQLLKTGKPSKGTQLEFLAGQIAGNGKISEVVANETEKAAAGIRKMLQHAKVDPSEVLKFNREYQAFQTSSLAPDAFAAFLTGFSERNRLGYRFPADWTLLIGDFRKMQSLEGSRIFDEFESFSEQVKQSLFISPKQRELDRRGHELRVLEKLAKLSLTPKEQGTLNEIVTSRSAEHAAILGLSRAHLDFYANASARDEIFFERLQRMSRDKDVLFVAGGFHTRAMTERLRSAGISYLVIRPVIRRLPEKDAYRRQMRGDVSWKDHFEIENGRVDLYKAFVRGTRDKLLQGPESVELKDWRDQMIRDLGTRGQIEKAGEYTAFIDEKLKVPQGTAPEWLRNMDRFIDGLKRLDAAKQFTEQNIFNLIKPSTVLQAAGGNASAARGSILPVSMIGPSRSEARVYARIQSVDDAGKKREFEILEEKGKEKQYVKLKDARTGELFFLKRKPVPQEIEKLGKLKGSNLIQYETVTVAGQPALLAPFEGYPESWAGVELVPEGLTGYTLTAEAFLGQLKDQIPKDDYLDAWLALLRESMAALDQMIGAGYLTTDNLDYNMWVVTDAAGELTVKLGDFAPFFDRNNPPAANAPQVFANRVDRLLSVFNQAMDTEDPRYEPYKKLLRDSYVGLAPKELPDPKARIEKLLAGLPARSELRIDETNPMGERIRQLENELRAVWPEDFTTVLRHFEQAVKALEEKDEDRFENAIKALNEVLSEIEDQVEKIAARMTELSDAADGQTESEALGLRLDVIEKIQKQIPIVQDELIAQSEALLKKAEPGYTSSLSEPSVIAPSATGSTYFEEDESDHRASEGKVDLGLDIRFRRFLAGYLKEKIPGKNTRDYQNSLKRIGAGMRATVYSSELNRKAYKMVPVEGMRDRTAISTLHVDAAWLTGLAALETYLGEYALRAEPVAFPEIDVEMGTEARKYNVRDKYVLFEQDLGRVLHQDYQALRKIATRREFDSDPGNLNRLLQIPRILFTLQRKLLEEKGVLVFDMSPRNVIRVDGKVALSDFDLARLVQYDSRTKKFAFYDFFNRLEPEGYSQETEEFFLMEFFEKMIYPLVRDANDPDRAYLSTLLAEEMKRMSKKQHPLAGIFYRLIDTEQKREELAGIFEETARDRDRMDKFKAFSLRYLKTNLFTYLRESLSYMVPNLDVDKIREDLFAARSELRSEDSARFIARPDDFGQGDYVAKTYAAARGGEPRIYYYKTLSYEPDQIGRVAIANLTFRLMHYEQPPRAANEDSEQEGPAVGAASPDYQLEFYLEDEHGIGYWRKAEDVELLPNRPVLVYRGDTKQALQPGLFDFFMDKEEQARIQAEVAEHGRVLEPRMAVIVSWRGEDGLIRNYYLPWPLDDSDQHTIVETYAEVKRISRSSVTDPKADQRITIFDDESMQETVGPMDVTNAMPYAKGQQMTGYVRPAHLGIMITEDEKISLQVYGATNGVTVEERKDIPEEELAENSAAASQLFHNLPPNASLFLTDVNNIEGAEGMMQFVYDGEFVVLYDDFKKEMAFRVDEGKLFFRTSLSGTWQAAVENLKAVNDGEDHFEVEYSEARITITNRAESEDRRIRIVRLRSEARATPLLTGKLEAKDIKHVFLMNENRADVEFQDGRIAVLEAFGGGQNQIMAYRENGRVLLLKLMKSGLNEEQEKVARQNFEKEIRVSNYLREKEIEDVSRVIWKGEVDIDREGILIEGLELPHLYDYRGRLPFKYRLQIFRQYFDEVLKAHRNGVALLDLKPAHVLLEVHQEAGEEPEFKVHIIDLEASIFHDDPPETDLWIQTPPFKLEDTMHQALVDAAADPASGLSRKDMLGLASIAQLTIFFYQFVLNDFSVNAMSRELESELEGEDRLMVIRILTSFRRDVERYRKFWVYYENYGSKIDADYAFDMFANRLKLLSDIAVKYPAAKILPAQPVYNALAVKEASKFMKPFYVVMKFILEKILKPFFRALGFSRPPVMDFNITPGMTFEQTFAEVKKFKRNFPEEYFINIGNMSLRELAVEYLVRKAKEAERTGEFGIYAAAEDEIVLFYSSLNRPVDDYLGGAMGFLRKFLSGEPGTERFARSELRAEAPDVPPFFAPGYAVPRDLGGVKKTVTETLDWLIAIGYPEKDILLEYRALVQDAQELPKEYADRGILMRKSPRADDPKKIQISLNRPSLTTLFEKILNLASVDREGAISYFMEIVVPIFVREAFGAKVFPVTEPEAEEMVEKMNRILFAERQREAGQITIPASDALKAFLIKYREDVIRIAALAVAGEVFEAQREYEYLDWASGRGLYDPDKTVNALSKVNDRFLINEWQMMSRLVESQGEIAKIISWSLSAMTLAALNLTFAKSKMEDPGKRSVVYYFLFLTAEGKIDDGLVLGNLNKPPAVFPLDVYLKGSEELVAQVESILPVWETRMRSEVRSGKAFNLVPSGQVGRRVRRAVVDARREFLKHKKSYAGKLLPGREIIFVYQQVPGDTANIAVAPGLLKKRAGEVFPPAHVDLASKSGISRGAYISMGFAFADKTALIVPVQGTGRRAFSEEIRSDLIKGARMMLEILREIRYPEASIGETAVETRYTQEALARIFTGESAALAATGRTESGLLSLVRLAALPLDAGVEKDIEEFRKKQLPAFLKQYLEKALATSEFLNASESGKRMLSLLYGIESQLNLRNYTAARENIGGLLKAIQRRQNPAHDEHMEFDPVFVAALEALEKLLPSARSELRAEKGKPVKSLGGTLFTHLEQSDAAAVLAPYVTRYKARFEELMPKLSNRVPEWYIRQVIGVLLYLNDESFSAVVAPGLAERRGEVYVPTHMQLKEVSKIFHEGYLPFTIGLGDQIDISLNLSVTRVAADASHPVEWHNQMVLAARLITAILKEMKIPDKQIAFARVHTDAPEKDIRVIFANDRKKVTFAGKGMLLSALAGLPLEDNPDIKNPDYAGMSANAFFNVLDDYLENAHEALKAESADEDVQALIVYIGAIQGMMKSRALKAMRDYMRSIQTKITRMEGKSKTIAPAAKSNLDQAAKLLTPAARSELRMEKDPVSLKAETVVRELNEVVSRFVNDAKVFLIDGKIRIEFSEIQQGEGLFDRPRDVKTVFDGALIDSDEKILRLKKLTDELKKNIADASVPSYLDSLIYTAWAAVFTGFLIRDAIDFAIAGIAEFIVIFIALVFRDLSVSETRFLKSMKDYIQEEERRGARSELRAVEPAQAEAFRAVVRNLPVNGTRTRIFEGLEDKTLSFAKGLMKPTFPRPDTGTTGKKDTRFGAGKALKKVEIYARALTGNEMRMLGIESQETDGVKPFALEFDYEAVNEERQGGGNGRGLVIWNGNEYASLEDAFDFEYRVAVRNLENGNRARVFSGQEKNVTARGQLKVSFPRADSGIIGKTEIVSPGIGVEQENLKIYARVLTEQEAAFLEIELKEVNGVMPFALEFDYESKDKERIGGTGRALVIWDGDKYRVVGDDRDLAYRVAVKNLKKESGRVRIYEGREKEKVMFSSGMFRATFPNPVAGILGSGNEISTGTGGVIDKLEIYARTMTEEEALLFGIELKEADGGMPYVLEFDYETGEKRNRETNGRALVVWDGSRYRPVGKARDVAFRLAVRKLAEDGSLSRVFEGTENSVVDFSDASLRAIFPDPYKDIIGLGGVFGIGTRNALKGMRIFVRKMSVEEAKSLNVEIVEKNSVRPFILEFDYEAEKPGRLSAGSGRTAVVWDGARYKKVGKTSELSFWIAVRNLKPDGSRIRVLEGEEKKFLNFKRGLMHDSFPRGDTGTISSDTAIGSGAGLTKIVIYARALSDDEVRLFGINSTEVNGVKPFVLEFDYEAEGEEGENQALVVWDGRKYLPVGNRRDIEFRIAVRNLKDSESRRRVLAGYEMSVGGIVLGALRASFPRPDAGTVGKNVTYLGSGRDPDAVRFYARTLSPDEASALNIELKETAGVRPFMLEIEYVKKGENGFSNLLWNGNRYVGIERNERLDALAMMRAIGHGDWDAARHYFLEYLWQLPVFFRDGVIHARVEEQWKKTHDGKGIVESEAKIILIGKGPMGEALALIYGKKGRPLHTVVDTNEKMQTESARWEESRGLDPKAAVRVTGNMLKLPALNEKYDVVHLTSRPYLFMGLDGKMRVFNDEDMRQAVEQARLVMKKDGILVIPADRQRFTPEYLASMKALGFEAEPETEIRLADAERSDIGRAVPGLGDAIADKLSSINSRFRIFKLTNPSAQPGDDLKFPLEDVEPGNPRDTVERQYGLQSGSFDFGKVNWDLFPGFNQQVSETARAQRGAVTLGAEMARADELWKLVRTAAKQEPSAYLENLMKALTDAGAEVKVLASQQREQILDSIAVSFSQFYMAREFIYESQGYDVFREWKTQPGAITLERFEAAIRNFDSVIVGAGKSGVVRISKKEWDGKIDAVRGLLGARSEARMLHDVDGYVRFLFARAGVRFLDSQFATDRGVFKAQLNDITDDLAAEGAEPDIRRIIDLGSGQGGMVLAFAAGNQTAEVLGIEFDPGLYADSAAVLEKGVLPEMKSRVRFRLGDFNSSEFSDEIRKADLLYYYETGSSAEKTLVETLNRKMKIGARVLVVQNDRYMSGYLSRLRNFTITKQAPRYWIFQKTAEAELVSSRSEARAVKPAVVQRSELRYAAVTVLKTAMNDTVTDAEARESAKIFVKAGPVETMRELEALKAAMLNAMPAAVSVMIDQLIAELSKLPPGGLDIAYAVPAGKGKRPIQDFADAVKKLGMIRRVLVSGTEQIPAELTELRKDGIMVTPLKFNQRRTEFSGDQTHAGLVASSEADVEGVRADSPLIPVVGMDAELLDESDASRLVIALQAAVALLLAHEIRKGNETARLKPAELLSKYSLFTGFEAAIVSSDGRNIRVSGAGVRAYLQWQAMQAMSRSA